MRLVQSSSSPSSYRHCWRTVSSLIVAVVLVLHSNVEICAAIAPDNTTTTTTTATSTTTTTTTTTTSSSHDSTTTTTAARLLLAAAWDSMSETFDEMWLRETKEAHQEMERQMMGGLLSGGDSLSMVVPTVSPPQPPTPPLAAPVPQPSSPPAVAVVPTIVTTSSPVIDSTDDCLNGRTSEQYLLDTLVETTSTSLDVLLNPLTSQGRAFSFLLNDTLIDTNEQICNHTTLPQRYGLATLYFATNGTSWKNNTNWPSSSSISVPECQWYGILCNNNNQVINITLADNNLVGTLPDEISTLYMIDRMELYSNNITGSLPDGIQNCTLLQVLDIEFNQLSGMAFHPNLLSLSNLRQLFISRNRLTGTIPSNLPTVFPLVTDVWMAGNEIMGPLPTTLGSMTNLRTWIAYENQLDGSIPTNIGNITDLSNLQLYSNMFDATIPTQIYALTLLSVLRVDQNFFTGTIASDIGQLSQLTDLRFSNNFFEGTIPDTVQQLQNLSYFIVSNTLLSGSIPNVFADFDALLDFDVSTAFFTGPIPSTLFTNIAIQNIYMSNNAFTGTIPSNFSNPIGLIDLYLDNNLLNGTVPTINMGDFLLLNELLLHNNELSGSVPSTICALRNITLENLFSDCGGAMPEITCVFPTCCNRCFAGGQITNQRSRRQQQQQHQRILHMNGDQHE